jgi:hypothetical protein
VALAIAALGFGALGAAALALRDAPAGPVAIVPGNEPFVGPTAMLPIRFHADAFELRQLPPDELPYVRDAYPSLTEPPLVDAAGARVVERDGAIVDHPVAQAQYGLGLLAGLAATNDADYLRRARIQADRLMDRAVWVEEVIYFPYPFDFPRHGDPIDVMRAPWYSGMAQGQALSLLVRLAETTGDDRYADAADATFDSFLRLRRKGSDPDSRGIGLEETDPWIAFVDEHGYYWVEEYAGGGRPPDLTFNGLGFALYGLVDYARFTGDPDARLLIRGLLTTIDRAAAAIRVAGETSRYCLTHGTQDARYHATHIGQMEELHRLTGDRRFARWATLLRQDSGGERG